VEEENGSIPLVFQLSQNYPNPFNPSTVISYQLPVTSNVTLKVYDILGREVATLVNEEKSAGSYEIQFDSHSGEDRNLTSGIYFYQLKAGDYSETRKMILLR
jgi:flagellar hook assembly protein FlgD